MKLSTMTRFSAVLVLALCGAVAFSQSDETAPPSAPPHHMHHRGEMFGGPMFPFFARQLDLTADQQAQMKQIFKNAKPTLHPLMEQEMQSRHAMMQLITSGSFDAAKAQAIAAQESQIHAQIEVQHAQLASQAYQLLTPEQKAKLAEIMAKHQQRMQERMQPHAPADAPEGGN